MKQYDETDHRDDATTASDDSDTLDSIIDKFPQDVTFPDDRAHAVAETDGVRDGDGGPDDVTDAVATESLDASGSFDTADPAASPDSTDSTDLTDSTDTAAHDTADDTDDDTIDGTVVDDDNDTAEGNANDGIDVGTINDADAPDVESDDVDTAGIDDSTNADPGNTGNAVNTADTGAEAEPGTADAAETEPDTDATTEAADEPDAETSPATDDDASQPEASSATTAIEESAGSAEPQPGADTDHEDRIDTEADTDPADGTDVTSTDAAKPADGDKASDASAHRFADAFATMRSGLSALAPVGRAIRTVWNKRPKLSFALYAIVFVIVDTASVLALQWSVYSPIEYAEDADVDTTTRVMGTMLGQLTKFVSQTWLEHQWQFLLNFLVLGLIYLVVITLFNRFWVPTALFGTVMIVFAVANKFKVAMRNEPIIPADLNFVSSGNTGELLSFIPDESMALVRSVVVGLAYFIAVCVALQILDRRGGLFPCHWRPSRFVSVRNITAVVCRVAAFVACASLLFSYVWNLSVPNSWAQQWSRSLSDSPQLWNALDDSRSNGPAINFLRLAHSKTMDEPEGYSQEAMEEIADRYAVEAEAINATRTNNLTDNTVIMILSESFSDPTRVPGVALTVDPMPGIRMLKETTTSGLMLSPGYGGGTANIEYQALTGLDMANFDESMLSVYQQLVPSQDNPYSFNQIWTAVYGESGSIAFHPYFKNMYFRDGNYQKFGFSELLTLDSDPAIEYQDHAGSSPYVSDAAAYNNVLAAIEEQDQPQFIQLVTMQNHASYGDYYEYNEFYDADLSTFDDGERRQIDNYTKGVSLTDQATTEFLNALDQIDKPITVIFYGDHLPSIYATANADPNNTLALHETDYFIWSNLASASNDVKLGAETTSFSSSNYCMSMAAAHMNATVSPYLALLTELQQQVPSISRVGGASAGWGEGDATYLDMYGNVIDPDTLSILAQQLLADYQMVQYDMTAGEGYLRDTAFYDVPEAQNVTLTKNPVPGSGFTTDTPIFEQYVAEQPLY
ncbi:LTA synthase family protein [Bifidobacterium phasiani]|uniref:Sulfatase-like hydrolase/transferase n=1 Tax=Bifidobacterium phasiani TaxID=2834431 RepID=A0ABS6WA25_9BIFI|nr:LTA synthase family protein [Bifidobacterium phasiani]MBW3083365.1 sulfatase-like hydrolase/transferase [Bifidobacterium phasiani]